MLGKEWEKIHKFVDNIDSIWIGEEILIGIWIKCDCTLLFFIFNIVLRNSINKTKFKQERIIIA